jgi:putative transposase
MDGCGAWRDHIFIERLRKTVTYEQVNFYAYDSVADARKSILKYFEWYNQFRPHSSLGKRTPNEAYIDMLPVVGLAM